MTYQRLFNQNKMTDATYGTGTAYPSGTSDVTKVFTPHCTLAHIFVFFFYVSRDWYLPLCKK
jgi:hypothetical protein